jgi:hypothetical protein
MKTAVLIGLAVLWTLQTQGDLRAQEKPKVKIPESGVSQIMTMEGKFVRAAYNNEGYVILGYQVVNRSVGDEWVLLEVGMTLLNDTKDSKMTRDAMSLEIPGGKTIPLATTMEYRAANLSALEARTKVQRDSINYFPPMASQACRLGFFSELNSRVMPWDEVELSSRRGCLGRLFFQVPGGITHGQYWLNVKFPTSVVRVPFRVFTEEEEKMLSKNFGSIKKQIDAAFKPKKKS